MATRHPTLLNGMKQGVCSRTATAAITADGVSATVLSKTRQTLGVVAARGADERELEADAGAGCAGVVAARGADERELEADAGAGCAGVEAARGADERELEADAGAGHAGTSCW